MNINVGVIGYGYWGPNILRNMAETDGVTVTWCADARADRRIAAARRYPALKVTDNADDIIDDPNTDAVAIVTPVRTHYKLAKRALEQGKHVLVEKPMAASVREAEELNALAQQRGCVLMVDHTFIYTGAVQRIRELIGAGELGELLYLDSVRVNLGIFQSDVDVLWDLAPHDLSILAYLVPDVPRYVSATGADHTGGGQVDMAYISLHYKTSFMAHLHVNWLSPVKVRQILIGGSRRMLVYDDMNPSEKVRIYDRGIKITTQEGIYGSLIDYRMGDMWSPKLEIREALSTECKHFVECIRSKSEPLSSGNLGLTVVKILEAAGTSLAEDGRRVAL